MEVNRGEGKFTTKDMVETALLIGLVFVATFLIKVPMPFMAASGGLVHTGTAMLFIASIVFGKEKGAIAGAVGMGLFDLSSGWALWAPFTFVIRGVMGYMIGTISWSKNRKGNNVIVNVFALILSGVWMIVGYYITEGVLYGNWIAPVGSIPGNVLQIIIGLIGLPIAMALKKYIKYI